MKDVHKLFESIKSPKRRPGEEVGIHSIDAARGKFWRQGCAVDALRKPSPARVHARNEHDIRLKPDQILPAKHRIDGIPLCRNCAHAARLLNDAADERTLRGGHERLLLHEEEYGRPLLAESGCAFYALQPHPHLPGKLFCLFRNIQHSAQPFQLSQHPLKGTDIERHRFRARSLQAAEQMRRRAVAHSHAEVRGKGKHLFQRRAVERAYAYPTFRIEIKASKSKDNMKGLDTKFMKKYIEAHDDAEHTVLKEFYSLRGLDENGKPAAFAIPVSYGQLKMWFLSKYPAVEAMNDTVNKIIEQAKKAREEQKAAKLAA